MKRADGTTDAIVVFDRDAPDQGTDGELKKGRNNAVSALFHVCSQVVTARLACLSVVTPALVMRSVTPLP